MCHSATNAPTGSQILHEIFNFTFVCTEDVFFLSNFKGHNSVKNCQPLTKFKLDLYFLV